MVRATYQSAPCLCQAGETCTICANEPRQSRQISNAFCPTGDGGGRRNDCPPGGEGHGPAVAKLVAEHYAIKQQMDSVEYGGREHADLDKRRRKVFDRLKKEAGDSASAFAALKGDTPEAAPRVTPHTAPEKPKVEASAPKASPVPEAPKPAPGHSLQPVTVPSDGRTPGQHPTKEFGERPELPAGLQERLDRHEGILREKLKDKRLERAYSYDASGDMKSTGVGREQSGGRQTVGADLFDGGSLTHSHPRGNSFSADDMITAARRSLKQMRAVTDEGVFVLGPPKGGWGSVRLSEFEAAVRRQTGRSAHANEDVENLAERFGLHYRFDPVGATRNAFCPTGPEGGRDNSCSGRTRTRAPRAKVPQVTDTPALDAAKAKYVGKPVGASEHAHAAKVAKDLARTLGGKTEAETADAGQRDKKPYDVKVPKATGKGDHDIEVKTLQKSSKQSLSVHEDALLRKVRHAEANPDNTFHTVARDDRAIYEGGAHAANYSGHTLYYRRGSGPYYLSTMHPVKDEAELKHLLDTPDHLLPEKARGSLPPPPPVDKLEARAAAAHEKRYARDRARKDKIRDVLAAQQRERRARIKADRAGESGSGPTSNTYDHVLNAETPTMTLSITFEGVENEAPYTDGPFDLCSNSSWSQFASDVVLANVEPGPLLELVGTGLCSNTAGLRVELDGLLANRAEDISAGSVATASRLVDLVKNGWVAELAAITDEEGYDDGEEGVGDGPAPVEHPQEAEGPTQNDDGSGAADASVGANDDFCIVDANGDYVYVDNAAKAKLSGGRWVTIKGSHVYIKGGKPIAGAPALLKALAGRSGGKTGAGATGKSHTEMANDLASKFKKTGKLSKHEGEILFDSLNNMSHKELDQLKKAHGISAGGAKGEKAQKLADQLRSRYEGKAGAKAGATTKAGKAGPDGEVTSGRTGVGGGGGAGTGKAGGTGGGVAAEAQGPVGPAAGQGGAAPGQPAGAGASRTAASPQEAGRRLDRLANFFRAKGQHEVAGWMDRIKDHVSKVGTEEALKGLGIDLGDGKGKQAQYKGMWENEHGGLDFINGMVEPYLRRHGIIPTVAGAAPIKGAAVVSPRTVEREEALKTGGHAPVKQTLTKEDAEAKLEEAKRLPGLAKSEDLAVIMGGRRGDAVTHLTPDVTRKLDAEYGEGKWIVKSYGESAFAGHGIYFPQKAKQQQKDAQDAIWASGGDLGKYGFSHLREGGKPDGTIVGIKHEGGDEYRFGTDKYHNTIQGHVREIGDRVAEAAKHEKGAQLAGEDDGKGNEVNIGKRYMAQPAFDVVGITEQERAQGKLFAPGEGRVHIVTKDGKAEIIPHSTWLKGNDNKWEDMPVVFETDDHKKMQKAALDAINALPHSERQGQVYGPDIVKTKGGYSVVEANPANEAGGSGALGDNPFIIDAYASHVVGRSPAHVRFIRDLLTKRSKEKAPTGNTSSNPYEDPWETVY